MTCKCKKHVGEAFTRPERLPVAHGPGIVLLIVTVLTICVWFGPLFF